MKLGIIVYSTDAEVVFNAIRLANFFKRKRRCSSFSVSQWGRVRKPTFYSIPNY